MKKTLLSLLALLTVLYCSAQSPAWQWGSGIVAQSFDISYSIATDAEGNSYVTGRYNGDSLTVGGIVLTKPSANQDDIFLIKYDACGDVLWAKSIGGNKEDQGSSVAVDSKGYLYLTGFYQSDTLQIGDYTLYRTMDTGNMFVARFDASGDALWARSAVGTGEIYPNSITTDKEDNAIITGGFSGDSLSLSNTPLVGYNHSWDGFVAKYDQLGNVKWVKRIAGNRVDQGNSITVDVNDNILVAGQFESDTLQFDSHLLPKLDSGDYAIFLAKFDSSGNYIWSREVFGDLPGQEAGAYNTAGGVATDAEGNVIIAGGFYTLDINFGGIILYHSTGLSYINPDVYVAKYDSSGNILWAKVAGGKNDDLAGGVATDSHNNIYIAGVFLSDTITFDVTSLINTGLPGFDNPGDLFLTKYDPSGTMLLAIRQEGGEGIGGGPISIDHNDNVLLTGTFGGTGIFFGKDTLHCRPVDDFGFIAKFGLPNAGCVTQTPVVIRGNTFSIMPNPATDEVTITSANIIRSVNIYAMTGQLVISNSCNTNELRIGVQQLPAGAYMVQVTDNTGITKTTKLIRE